MECNDNVVLVNRIVPDKSILGIGSCDDGFRWEDSLPVSFHPRVENMTGVKEADEKAHQMWLSGGVYAMIDYLEGRSLSVNIPLIRNYSENNDGVRRVIAHCRSSGLLIFCVSELEGAKMAKFLCSNVVIKFVDL